MAVKFTKPEINVREKLAELDKPSGIAGEAILRAETPQEQQALIGVGRRNMVINGDFKIAQRATSATIPQTDSVLVSVDRWNVRAYSAENFVGTFAQSSDAPKGHKKSLKWTTTTAESAVASDELYSFQTRLEGQDLQHLNYGSNDAQEMTLSFWVKSSVTGTYHAVIYQDDGVKIISKTYTINSANTWEYKTVSISGNIASAINDDNTIGMRLEFVVAAGTIYQGTTPTGHWEAYTNAKYNALASSNNVVTTANATFFITGVQLELGKVATPFEHRSYGEELALCQRYFEVLEDLQSTDSNGAASTETLLGLGYCYTTTRVMGHVTWKATKRVNPTCTVSPVTDIQCLSSAGAWISATGVDVRANKNSARLDITTGSAMPAAGQACEVRFNTASPVGYIYIDAEL